MLGFTIICLKGEAFVISGLQKVLDKVLGAVQKWAKLEVKVGLKSEGIF